MEIFIIILWRKKKDHFMSNKFIITFSQRSDISSFQPEYYCRIESDDLVELFSKFLLKLAERERTNQEFKARHEEGQDDIPF